MKNNKTKLLYSVLSLLLCLSMLLGSTFAWFTDSVQSGINVIAAGNLDVALYHSNAAVQDEPVGEATELFMDLQGQPILWEPGVVSYENLRIANEGDLALTYQLAIATANENYIVDGNNQYGLSQILKVGFVEGGITATDRAGVVASVPAANWTTLASFVKDGSLLPAGAGESEKTWGVVVYWEPGDNDNRWNLNNGKTLNQGEVLSIDLGVQLIATQEVNELDGFDNKYDENAKAEFFPGFQGGSAGAAVTADDQGVTTAEVAMDGGDVSAVIPAGVQVAEGTTSMALSVTLKDSSEANVQLGESEEKRALDVHIEGVAQGNTVPMLITLEHYLSTGINTGALRLYHVENGTPVAMTQVVAPANHNEFSYDPATGNVTLALASFSEVAVVADTNNTWNGTAATAFAGGTGTEADPYRIANADELAYFRNEVDGGRTFAGEYVKLQNNITLSKVNFDPIGWGYANKDWNAGGKEGMVFKGTFDGGNNAILDLYQQGWELEEANGTDYTYTNCGFGLFAAASGATFKNLTIYGADVKTECVEMGILVGLSQNTCIYDNIKIYNSKIANYQRPAGGLIGEVSGDGTTTISNVIIGPDVVVGSLWGDFDAPVGGVIGARWDDAGKKPQIVMENVEVSCRLDVYNDITSAYQWHAYRRAGMLIGNTDTPAANGKTAQTATADFLTCKFNEKGEESVIVHLGSWANYHYCEFSEEYNSSRYPWVRVEAGENNPAYSNPRWGVATDAADQPVTSLNHNHTEGDEHNISISFAQLYGGGQGVYGATAHTGVKMIGYRYSIMFVNNNEVLGIQYVTDDEVKDDKPFTDFDPDKTAENAAKAWVTSQGYANVVFDTWVNAGSTPVESIPASNKENITLYPSFTTPYTARFVDLDGNVLAWCFFNDKANSNEEKLGNAKATAESLLPKYDDVEFTGWETHIIGSNNNVTTEAYNASKFTGYKTDVTIYPVYTYNGDVNLIPVDTDGDGDTDEYHVGGYSNPAGVTVVKIPSVVLGNEITAVNANAFSSYDHLHVVVIPTSVKVIGSAAMSDSGWTDKGETVTIYYEGSYEEWKTKNYNTDWYEGLGDGSRVFFLNGGDKVDLTQGYIQVERNFKWQLSGGGYHSSITYKNSITQSMITTYSTEKCNCKVDGCKGNLRPDAKYWN